MNYENATHLLHCAHAIGTHRLEYTMRCHVLKSMGDGRMKVLVFGDMYWKGKDTLNRVRYVQAQRLTKRSVYLTDGESAPLQTVSPPSLFPHLKHYPKPTRK